MNKLEEAARDYLERKLLSYRQAGFNEILRFMVDFTQQNTLTLDSKIDEKGKVLKFYINFEPPYEAKLLTEEEKKWINSPTIKEMPSIIRDKDKQIEQLTKEREALKFKETKALQKYNKCSEDYWDKEKQLQAEKKKVKEMREGLMIVLNKWHLGEADRIIRELIANNF